MNTVQQTSLFPNSFTFQIGKLYLVEKHCYFHETRDRYDWNIRGGGYYEYKFNDWKARRHYPGKNIIVTPDDIDYVVAANNVVMCVEVGQETEISKKFGFQAIKIVYKEKIGWTGFPIGHESYFFSEK